MINEKDSKTTKAKKEALEPLEECKPLGSGVDSYFANPPGGSTSFHWLCTCGTLNAF